MSESNGPKVIRFHDVPLDRDVGVQYVAAVTDSSVVNEDVHVPVALQDLLRRPVHRVCVGQVEGDGAGGEGLEVEQSPDSNTHQSI